jgi:hypothetical protein
MIQGMILKVVIKQVMKAIEKADDKRIARSHHKRIEALEKNSHPIADFVCVDCGCKAKRVKKKTKKN